MKVTIRKIFLLLLTGVFSQVSAQLSQQATIANYGGGVSTGAVYSSEVAMSGFGGKVQGEELGAYLGLVAFNLKSATVSVETRADEATLPDATEGVLLRIEESGNYDTLDVITSDGGSFSFNPVFLGDYLIVADSDPEKYVATYFGDAFLWEEADVLTLSEDISVEIEIQKAPSASSGNGLVDGFVEEDFEDEEGRVEARRRAKRRKCGLRRRVTGGGRTGQNNGFELIAYGETNDQGEFEFGFLPQGVYRFFVEYPGIPIDESSFVQFEIGEEGVSDTEFTLAAFVTEEGITLELVLGITKEFFTQFEIFPNPSSDFIYIRYEQVLKENLQLRLTDKAGKVLLSKALKNQNNNDLQIDVSQLLSGMYFLSIYDEQEPSPVLTFKVIKK